MIDFDVPARRDPRPVEELMNAALTEPDERRAWEAVAALHWRGTAEVLDRAAAFCRSRCPEERRLGADILGQLGLPERTFPRRCVEILLGTLRAERNAEVLRCVLVALSHQHDPEAVPAVVGFAGHADPEVRHAAVLALMGHDDALALRCLIALSRDDDPRVRDWAAFALGTQTDADFPELRDALAERLSDEDDDARGEAMVGLAGRKDPRAIPAIEKELAVPEPMPLALEAAEWAEAPELVAPLTRLRGSDAVDLQSLERAVASCQRA